MMADNNLIPCETPNPPETAGALSVPPLQLDPDDYREDLAEFDLTAQQENELLEVLWNIMASFVAMGYGLDSVQLFSTGKTDDQGDIPGQDSGKLLEVKNTPEQFKKATNQRGSKED